MATPLPKSPTATMTPLARSRPVNGSSPPPPAAGAVAPFEVGGVAADVIGLEYWTECGDAPKAAAGALYTTMSIDMSTIALVMTRTI